MLRLWLIMVLLIGYFQISSSMNHELETWAQKYAPPKHVANFIEHNQERVMALRTIEFQPGRAMAFGFLKECPDVYFKGTSLERLINAERMRVCIKRHKLTSLDVARKYLYNVNGTWIVIAEYVTEVSDDKRINLDEFKHLLELAQRTGYFDWNFGANWVRDQRGKLVCCDTEDGSFCKSNSSLQWVYEYLWNAIGNLFFTQEALSYAQEYKKTLEGTCEEIKVPALCDDTQYDDPEIDIANIKNLVKTQKNILQ